MNMENPFIPILDLSPEFFLLGDEISAKIQKVLQSGHFIMGAEVKLFEEAVAQYLGVKHAIGVNSGTDALVLALRALEIGIGDEVITTPFSFFATAESISQVGAKPVFVDIDEKDYNIDVTQIEAQITPKTKAILPVHLYGSPAKMDKILEIANQYGLKVVEDCAQSFGASYQGKQSGTWGTLGAYSFFPSKNLGAYGDGGLVVTDDDVLAQQVRMLRVHGAQKKYHNEIIGYNSRLDTLQAAILSVKLPHVSTWNQRRRMVAERYNQAFADCASIIVPEITEGHVFHQYTIRLPHHNRNEVQVQLKEKGIGTMVYYPIPQDQLPIYKGQYPTYPVSQKLANEVLSLPMSPYLTDDNQARVISAVLEVLEV